MAKERRGHLCWSCGYRRPNEKFSGGGHARHLCNDCRRELRAQAKRAAAGERPPHCAHCGAENALTVAGCGGALLCDDPHEYQPFSACRSRCFQVHRCGALLEDVEMAERGERPLKTSFELAEAALSGAPSCRPVHLTELDECWMDREPDRPTGHIVSGPCARCSAWIRLEADEWSLGAGELWCGDCTREELGDVLALRLPRGRRGGSGLAQLFQRIRMRQRLRAARRRQRRRRRTRERTGQEPEGIRTEKR